MSLPKPLIAVAAPLLLAVLACSGGGTSDLVASGPKPAVLMPEDVIVVGTEAIAAGPRIAGTLEAEQKAVLRAEAGGSVVELLAEVGDRVEAGQVLARIESTAASTAYQSARSSVASAEQDLRNAERERERVEKLVAAGALSPRDLELATSGVTGARARLDGAKAQQAQSGEQVEGTTVRSPLAGIVSQRTIGSGDIVAPGSPLFTVIEPSSLRLEGSVPADSAVTLHVGAPVRFTVQGFTGRTFEGTVARVSPAVDPATRQIPILVTIPNADGTLLAGLFAEGRVATEERSGMVVPADAVDTSGREPHVLQVKDGKLERVAVVTGLVDADGEIVELTGGVSLGDVLVLGAKADLRPGMAVELRDVAAPEPDAVREAEGPNPASNEG